MKAKKESEEKGERLQLQAGIEEDPGNRETRGKKEVNKQRKQSEVLQGC